MKKILIIFSIGMMMLLMIYGIGKSEQKIFYKLFKSSFTVYQLRNIKTKVNNFLGRNRHPSLNFGYANFDDVVMVWGAKRLENFDIVYNAEMSGKIKKVGIVTFDRNGYKEDTELLSIQQVFKDLRQPQYSIGVSTP